MSIYIAAETFSSTISERVNASTTSFKGTPCTVHGIPPELDSSFCSEASPDGAQICTRSCTEILGHLADIFKVFR